MDGITILYTYTYTPGEIEFTFCVCMFIAFIVASVGSLMARSWKQCLIATVIALIFLVGCVITYGIKLNSRERYEVIIDNSIDYSEFNKKYKAIEVRGKIYTIEERVD